MFYPRNPKLWPKKCIPIKLAKIIGVFEDHFFSKIYSNYFFTTSKYAHIYKNLYKIGNVRKWSKIILDKKFN